MTTHTQATVSDKRDKMLQRVLNLRQKAENAAASEAEMNAALDMAAKLMDAYNIEEAELSIAEAEGRIVLDVITRKSDQNVNKKGSKQKHKVLQTLSAINVFTETKCVYSSYTGRITFTGHRPDVELAEFLVAVIKEALDREYEAYRKANTKVGYGAKASFQNAMANRVSTRLYKMARDRFQERKANKEEAERLKLENAETSTSTALVVSEIAEQKAREVKDAYRKAHPRVRTRTTYSRSSNYTAHGAGQKAGDRVNLGRAVSQNKTKALA